MRLYVSMNDYIIQLRQEEKSRSTVETYERSIRHFIDYMMKTCGESLTKESVICYKEMLQSQYNYSVSTINGILTAVNRFLKFLGTPQFCVKQLKQQKQIFIKEEKLLTEREYNQLLDAAEQQGKIQILLIMETICSCGIRVSELQYITKDAVECGMANIQLKGKNRVIFLPDTLRENLKMYMQREQITSGIIFATKHGNVMHRSNIWREMKRLSQIAGVNPKKVYPHNLRHLFARCYHKEKNDITMLADVLGHSSIDTTRIYLMTDGKEHKKIINELRLVRPMKMNEKGIIGEGIVRKRIESCVSHRKQVYRNKKKKKWNKKKH